MPLECFCYPHDYQKENTYRIYTIGYGEGIKVCHKKNQKRTEKDQLNTKVDSKEGVKGQR